ncbi:hypothetical protein IKS86_02980 [bacterium]|nr:hypothetical protein [bacterium]
MKKGLFFLIILLLAVGCSSSDNGETNDSSETGSLYNECYPDGTCDSGLVCDNEYNTCIKDNAVNDNKDEDKTSDETDTAPDGDNDDGGDSEPEDFKEGYKQSNYDNYVLFKGETVLQDEEAEDLNPDNTVELEIVIYDETYRDFEEIVASVYNGNIMIGSSKLIDEENDVFLSMTFYLSQKNLRTIRDFAEDLGYEDEIDFAPKAIIYKTKNFSEEGFVYDKFIAVGVPSETNPDFTGYSEGRMQLSYDENSTFDVGENFKIAFDLHLTADTDEINMQVYQSIFCYDSESFREIDCPEDIETIAGF